MRCLPERLEVPLRWRKPRRVFVDSMSDLFHPDVPEAFIAKVWATMIEARQHTFQVLTKRPQRMATVLACDHGYGPSGFCHVCFPTPNVWVGTSIESDRYTFRADHLRNTPAAIRFISAEPLLGPLPSLDLTGIDWLIAGGESGPGARPMHPDWVRDLRDRCAEADVAFFFKQWGKWAPIDNDWPPEFGRWVDPRDGLTRGSHTPGAVRMSQLGKKAAGRTLDGRTHDDMPTVAS